MNEKLFHLAMPALIFDLNGVFIQGPLLSDRFQHDFRVPPSEFLPVLSQIMADARRPGAHDMYSYWQPHFARWNVPLSREAFYDYWFTAEKENPEMIEYARSLKATGSQLFILSNNFAERATYYEQQFPFLRELFTDIHYSWQTGFVKPDEQCFTNLLAKHNLRAENCFYFDDVQKNIDSAKRMGLRAHLFNGKKTVEDALNR
jgi:HAD superfamily hydrolase (TIGR01509 family)